MVRNLIPSMVRKTDTDVRHPPSSESDLAILASHPLAIVAIIAIVNLVISSSQSSPLPFLDCQSQSIFNRRGVETSVSITVTPTLTNLSHPQLKSYSLSHLELCWAAIVMIPSPPYPSPHRLCLISSTSMIHIPHLDYTLTISRHQPRYVIIKVVVNYINITPRSIGYRWWDCSS